MEPSRSHDVDALERETLRRRSFELERDRDAALSAAADARQAYAAAIGQCDHLASEILAERRRHARELADIRTRELADLRTRELADLQARELADRQARELAELRHQAAHARETIENMERSWFWKLRLFFGRK